VVCNCPTSELRERELVTWEANLGLKTLDVSWVQRSDRRCFHELVHSAYLDTPTCVHRAVAEDLGPQFGRALSWAEQYSAVMKLTVLIEMT